MYARIPVVYTHPKIKSICRVINTCNILQDWYYGGMKIQNTKKTKYEQVSEILDKKGYITDSEAVKIFGIEDGIYRVNEHVRIWKKLRADEQFFADKKVIEKRKGHRLHLVRVEGQDSYYKVGKQFYNSINLTN